MNILELVMLAVLVVLVLSGFRQGLVRKLASVLSLALTMILASLLLPHMTDFLKERTPVYEYIVEKCQSVVPDRLTAGLTGMSVSGSSAADSYRTMNREEAKALMEQYGYDSSVVDALSDEQFEEYKAQLIDEYFGQSSGQEDADAPDTLSLTESQQETIIENLPLPEVLKAQILTHNNQEGYRRLQASTFQDYIINYISSAILNVAAFLLAVVIVQVILGIALFVLHALTRVPGIGFLNRLAGGALGAFQWLFLTWLFFLILSMCQATEAGQYLLQMVWDSDYLNLLYDSDLFIQIVLRAAAIFS